MSCSSSCKQFADLRIPLEEIVLATNNFSNANLIREDATVKEYKGQLFRSGQLINIVARSSKVLLDDFWEAKLSGFELSMNQTAAARNRLYLSEVCGTQGYCDPTFVKSGSVTHT
ncbi:hypothetical protein L2E82_27991 [Cichorium intybus]|uniref:Uncharacterized protein n=1 Tax=Cichorium intybus TaxID=13427 RepID=A0ACB9CUY9_CICIN|nr:hypothetical protein L2E82_27991 [Cichorium intybus]